MADKNISYWLMKSEPDAYSLEDLKNEKHTLWDGIRNYQARNFMRSMKIGDKVFFYHSNCKPPGIVGLMKVIETHITDPTQFDNNSKYFDPKSSSEKPRWDCARLKYLGEYKSKLSLQFLSENYSPEDMKLVKRGNRLSILPINTKIAIELINFLGEFK